LAAALFLAVTHQTLPAFWYREDARTPKADFALAKLLKIKPGSKLY
jgi:hypothetical protein